MIVVTGAAGFIGSNLVHALNAAGHTDILAVDDLTDGTKFANLADAKITDYQDKDEFLAALTAGTDELGPIEVIFHQGACSTTTEWNGKFMMDVNYRYSRTLMTYCRERGVPFIYASSASVYGLGKDGFTENPRCEHPLNVYAYSKLLFDQVVRRELATHPGGSQVVGLRYFNVYGPREAHKAGMASVAMHLRNQLREGQEVRLFEGSDGYGPGEQQRDFVHVDDVVALNLWFWRHASVSGLFNAGTGRAESFNDVAFAVLGWHGRGRIAYIPFPDKLKGRYQAFTEANLTHLRAAGCDHAFADVATGVDRYMDWLGAEDGESRPTV